MSAYPYSVDLALYFPFEDRSAIDAVAATVAARTTPPAAWPIKAGTLSLLLPTCGREEAKSGGVGGNQVRSANPFASNVIPFTARRLNAVGSETEERRIGAPRFSSSELRG